MNAVRRIAAQRLFNLHPLAAAIALYLLAAGVVFAVAPSFAFDVLVKIGYWFGYVVGALVGLVS